ncbi:MAG: exodeoxyribonuclease VII large subunit, partial [Coriobacteriales bacterium]|nr:exodeoxyribonuclease VII large subunit [Coriobacteriales bacterium]
MDTYEFEKQYNLQNKDAFSVSDALKFAKSALNTIKLKVEGEATDIFIGAIGKPIYFKLTDGQNLLQCRCWSNVYRSIDCEVHLGEMYEVTGYFDCYLKKGEMQFNVTNFEPIGEGKLRMRVAKLANKLEAEGLFASEHKKPINPLPKRIAIITSPHGKAVFDCIRTLKRRYPIAKLQFFGITVEGKTAVKNMISALEAVQKIDERPDTILFVRGGGSYEDLMPYNDEELARVIYACEIPIITGIGHEPDNSIADMVADKRCSTPTAAAENVAISIDELYKKVEDAYAALQLAIIHRLESARVRYSNLSDRGIFQNARLALKPYRQDFDMQLSSFLAAYRASSSKTNAILNDSRFALDGAFQNYISNFKKQIDTYYEHFKSLALNMMSSYGNELSIKAAYLDALSPLKT